MSRVIKFRLWDYTNNRYRHECNERLHFISGPGTTSLGRFKFQGAQVFKKNGWEHENISEYYDNESRLILEQFTGVKDKKDNDIYEGDIVKSEGELMGLYFNPTSTLNNDIRPERVRYTRVAKIVYDDGYAQFLLDYAPKYNYNGRGDFCGTAPWTEVIGNIHENPQLLT